MCVAINVPDYVQIGKWVELDKEIDESKLESIWHLTSPGTVSSLVLPELG